MAQGDLFDVGDVVRLAFVFTDAADVATDPSTVTVKVRAPDGTITTLTFANNEVVKDSAGHYHYDVDVDQDGIWRYRAESTGTAQAAVESRFEVRKSAF